MTDPNTAEETLTNKDIVQDIAYKLKRMSVDLLRLIKVEAKLFGHTLLSMIGLSVMIALMLAASWLFTAAALVVVLASLTMFSLSGALLTVALLHLVCAALSYWRLCYITRDLKFNESRISANHLLSQALAIVDPAEQSVEKT